MVEAIDQQRYGRDHRHYANGDPLRAIPVDFGRSGQGCRVPG